MGFHFDHETRKRLSRTGMEAKFHATSALRPSGRDYDPDCLSPRFAVIRVVRLQWSQVELATGQLHVRRAKNGSPSVHPMQGDEIRALRRLQREKAARSPAGSTGAPIW